MPIPLLMLSRISIGIHQRAPRAEFFPERKDHNRSDRNDRSDRDRNRHRRRIVPAWVTVWVSRAADSDPD